MEGTIEGGGNSEDIDGRGRDRCVVMLGDRGYVVWSNARRDRRACCASVGRGGFGEVQGSGYWRVGVGVRWRVVGLRVWCTDRVCPGAP